jgi:hypothetical protein
MLKSLRSFAAVAFGVVFAATAGAQGQEITIAVLPFGTVVTSTPNGTTKSTSTLLLAQQSVNALEVSHLYTVIDRSMDTAIDSELNRAESFRNFDSRVKLTTTERLNASVLLIGLVEREMVEMTPAKSRDGRPTYAAELNVRVKLVRTSTGELIQSELFSLKAQTAAAAQVDNRKLPRWLRDKVKTTIDDRVSGTLGTEMRPSSADEAVRQATSKFNPLLTEFLKQSYGTVVSALRK